MVNPDGKDKEMKNGSLQNIINELENLFELFNKKYFENKLSKPVITVSPDSTKGAYGWCTAWKAWKDGQSEYYEINMCAEHLTRPFEELAETMLHEMVHLWNTEHGIQDCSRGGFYHNAKFANATVQHGLIVEKISKYGWAKTELGEDAKKAIENFDGKSVFVLCRESAKKAEGKSKSKSSSRKYTCPCCGTSVRATKEVKIICADCNELMEAEM